MQTFISSLITLAIGGFLGGVIKSLLDYRSEVFSQLWSKRLDAYKDLWKIMKQIPSWPRLEDVTYAKLYTLSTAFKDWYFDVGGILLSDKTRKLYGELQEANSKIIANRKADDKPITDTEYETIQNLCSAVRSEMTKDLLSRKKLL